jgi:hypothetical protein
MLDNFVKKNILKIVVGVPLILLLFSLLFSKGSSGIENFEEIANPYLKTLPDQFLDVLIKAEQNDSTYVCSTAEALSRRELIIFKTFPTDTEKRLDFKVELYPTNKSLLKNNQTFLLFNITNEASIYRYNEKVYGVFRIALPFVDVEKLIVKQKSWEEKIDSPFKPLKKNLKPTLSEYSGQKSKPNPFINVFHKALESNNISFLPYSYSLKNDSLFEVKQSLDQYILKNNQTIGIIDKSNQFWSLTNTKHKALSRNIKFFGDYKEEANQLLEDYVNQDAQLGSVINLEKMAIYFAFKNVFSNSCNEKMYLLYNTKNKLLEPFFTYSNCLGLNPKNVETPKIKNLEFINYYILLLNSVSEINLYENFIEENDSFEQELSLINKYHPKLVFDLDVLNLNQRIIKKSLDATAEITAELVSYEEDKIIVEIRNNTIFPVDILGLNFKTKKEITRFETKSQILSKQKDTIEINLPRSFENLFVSKKKKQAGFMLYKDIYDLNIAYTTSSLNDTYLAPISPYQQVPPKNGSDLFRVKNTVANQEGLIILEDQKVITFNKDNVTINSPLIVPKGYQFKIKQGMTIDIIKGGKIVSHSPLQFIGTKQKPIKFLSSDEKGQGILVLSNGEHSELEHVIFDGLSNPTHGSWSVTGAVTFYESPVKMRNVTVSNNYCEDALNIVRTTFIIDVCTIKNTQSDAFDGDFVDGIIKNSKFINLGNDAIDISGSDLKIENVQISTAGDKGLSAGEDSKMTVNNVKITNSEIGVAGKDLSTVNAKNLEIRNTKLAFTAFQKKPEFGPSNIVVNSVVLDGVETKYLIENTSSMKVDGVIVETAQNVKDRMYGVEFGVSSDETRNRQ